MPRLSGVRGHSVTAGPRGRSCVSVGSRRRRLLVVRQALRAASERPGAGRASLLPADLPAQLQAELAAELTILPPSFFVMTMVAERGRLPSP